MQTRCTSSLCTTQRPHPTQFPSCETDGASSHLGESSREGSARTAAAARGQSFGRTHPPGGAHLSAGPLLGGAMGEMIDGEGGSFSSRWTLGGMLGRGHSARIFMAHDSQSGGTAACKLARHAPGMNWTRVVRAFEREAVLLKRCAHPNVVEFLGLFQGDTDVALVLSLAPSGDCQQLLQRHGALAERAATAIAQQVCSALDHIHTTARCLHRDVKLENVLVLNTGGVSGSPPRVQLCDFGHSCTIDPPHVDGAAFNDGFRGTEGYTAPEILVGSPWTTAADGWGLGVVYYALLANELLRWKPDGTPDVSTKTSRAFSQVTPSCKMRVKALLVTEPAERIELGSKRRRSPLAPSPPPLAPLPPPLSPPLSQPLPTAVCDSAQLNAARRAEPNLAPDVSDHAAPRARAGHIERGGRSVGL